MTFERLLKIKAFEILLKIKAEGPPLSQSAARAGFYILI
jgi:hypothetical protein